MRLISIFGGETYGTSATLLLYFSSLPMGLLIFYYQVCKSGESDMVSLVKCGILILFHDSLLVFIHLFTLLFR